METMSCCAPQKGGMEFCLRARNIRIFNSFDFNYCANYGLGIHCSLNGDAAMTVRNCKFWTHAKYMPSRALPIHVPLRNLRQEVLLSVGELEFTRGSC